MVPGPWSGFQSSSHTAGTRNLRVSWCLAPAHGRRLVRVAAQRAQVAAAACRRAHQPHFPDTLQRAASPLSAASPSRSLAVWTAKLPRRRMGTRVGGKGRRDGADGRAAGLGARRSCSAADSVSSRDTETGCSPHRAKDGSRHWCCARAAAAQRPPAALQHCRGCLAAALIWAVARVRMPLRARALSSAQQRQHVRTVGRAGRRSRAARDVCDRPLASAPGLIRRHRLRLRSQAPSSSRH